MEKSKNVKYLIEFVRFGQIKCLKWCLAPHWAPSLYGLNLITGYKFVASMQRFLRIGYGFTVGLKDWCEKKCFGLPDTNIM